MNAESIFWIAACISCFFFGINVGLLLSTFDGEVKQ